MGVNERGVTDSSLAIYWWIQSPADMKLEFIPSISRVGSNDWVNKTATDGSEFEFTNLEAFTKYNVTVYVKIQNSPTVFPPAKYFIARTLEGVPSPPWDLKATQVNESHILLTWKPPRYPKGPLTTYSLTWYDNDKVATSMRFSASRTQYLLPVDVEHGKSFNFYVSVFNI